MDEKQQDRREERHKRRIRNQMIAYIAVLVFITVAAATIVVSVKLFMDGKQAEQTVQESNQAALEDMLASEETLQTPEPTQEPEPTVEPGPTPEQRLDEMVRERIGVMPLADKVAGLFLVTPESITGVSTAVKAGEGTQNALAQYAVGGIVYATKNIKSEEQFKEMLANTQSYTKYDDPVFLAVEEEGGSVSTVTNAGIGVKVDSPKTTGQSGSTDNAYQSGVTLGGTLSSMGINLDLAPVADIATADNSWLGDRAYGTDAQLTGSMAGAMLQGLQSQGVTACVKFFPGVGSTAENPGKGLAATDRTAEQCESEEFAAFRQTIESGAEMMMISNVAAPGLTGDNEPCTFSSRVVTDILRGELGFEGVIVSGALNMAVVSDYYGADEAAIMALKAGCDMLYLPEDFTKAYQAVLQAVQDGTISEERIDDALCRIYRIKYADRIE